MVVKVTRRVEPEDVPGAAPVDGGLEGLAGEAEGLGAPPADPAAAAAADQEAAQAAAAMAKIEAGVAKVIFAGLRAMRTKIAAKNEFILVEWSDDMLREPADAAVPVMRKRLGMIFAALGDQPEEAALAMALMPLIMGYVEADSRNAKAKGAILVAPPAPAAPHPAGSDIDSAAVFAPNDPRSVTLNG